MSKRGSGATSNHGSDNSKQKRTGRRSRCGNNCPWCLRDFSIENPIRSQREKYPTLPRARDSGPCQICICAKRKHRPDIKDKDFSVELKDDDKQKAWARMVQLYVHQKNGDPIDDVEGYVKPEFEFDMKVTEKLV